jgi:gamma-glutamylcyclotransferase (GGCT)/AIG2-like uncharacterized protein YtfP
MSRPHRVALAFLLSAALVGCGPAPAPAAEPTIDLFVYGTLRRDAAKPIERMVPTARYLGPGAIRGALHDLGEYPGVRLEGEGRVVGELYAVPASAFATLDDYEGVAEGDYARRPVVVETAAGPHPAQVYEVDLARFPQAKPLPSGDWMTR